MGFPSIEYEKLLKNIIFLMEALSEKNILFSIRLDGNTFYGIKWF